MVPTEEIEALVGHKFPGGEYTIEHWENFLLTECTGADLLPDAMVHPVALFHVPILGCNTSIAEMFALGQAESDFSIGIESYDWEIFAPLFEDTCYQISGRVTEAGRRQYDTGHTMTGSLLSSQSPTRREMMPPAAPSLGIIGEG